MRLNEPRIKALAEEEWDEDAKALLKPFIERGGVLNIFRTMANHPDLARRWMVFANHILGKSTLAVRERELVILRIGYLCQSGYEWGQHVIIAREAGMTDEEIRSCKTGPDTPGLSELDRLLLKATDELHEDAFVSDETWAALSEHLSEQQLMDLVFTAGQYNLVSMALNSFGVQADEGLPGWDV
ncbi:MAG: carboxymuconolactone decarboxylase family protein [Gammaproteobacteria bacterium]|jgi:alkylhydroperoxidase family enzyme|nr:MAG: carboxymuconolactone decarboxylase family protein [Gammaproteobacteria bacterium]